MTPGTRIGDEGRRLTPIRDARGVFPEPLEDLFAGLAGPWTLDVYCFLIQAGHRVVLVDTGLGPPWAPAGDWFDPAATGGLPGGLAAAGVAPGEVTDVVLTHLHADHIGWNVADETAPTPYFPNARHIVQMLELKAIPNQAPAYQTHIVPLADAGILDVVDGRTTLLPGIELVPAPGHTPGHQAVLVDRHDRIERPVLLAGDAFVHPAQVNDPDLAYRYEADPGAAAGTRRELLRLVTERDADLAPAHFDRRTPAG